jgi:crossover junction endodeoxyribonuclease RusA
MSSLMVDLPYPPSANKLWRYVGGRPIKSAHYRAWLHEAATLVVLAVRADIIEGPYALYIRAGRPDNRRRDIDNLIKPISDALTHGGAVRDDCNCQRIEAEWVSDLSGIRVRVLSTKEVAA